MNVLLRAFVVLALWDSSQLAFAQSYPSKSLRIVVGFPAGGPIDIVARMMAPKLSEALGQQVVVDNRGGANGMIGTEFVAKSAPDGYTMILTSTGLAINPHLYPKIPYDTLRDLAPVTLVTSTPELFVVHPSVPAKTMKEMIALAKARPRQISIASTGSGGLPHLALELLKNAAKIEVIHVPYKGAAPAVTDLLGGQVSGLFADLPVLQPYITSARLRALAVASPKRSKLLADVPTMTEQGLPSVEAINWYGVLVAAKTPPEVIAKLHDAIVKSLNDAELREKLVSRGADPIPSTSEQFAAFLKDELAKWGRIAKESGAKID
ncbi:MAG TPA: tripartite tricarboxylate transporter substrate binding protein [Burkholderiales bacterium]|jgi:tripartite-type tricarboxylate transporter receptor subunit TctC|nr:tripartite tricarboxylate transporter substrate binding protein [Burkholderiales bacterium]